MFPVTDISIGRRPGVVVHARLRRPRRVRRVGSAVESLAAAPRTRVSSARRDPAARPPMTIDPEASISLDILLRARAGDQDAITRLVEHYRPRLERWAHGRLPQFARDIEDTRSIVQAVMIKAVRRLPSFQPDRPHAWRFYLCTAVKHAIIDCTRRVQARPRLEPLDERLPSIEPSPDRAAMSAEIVELYTQALSTLPPDMQEMLVDSLEWDMSHAELAAKFGKPSVDAARMAVSRAKLQLAAAMARMCGKVPS
jgi:RNA polymerase sigma factor (sigma-70 family)